MKGNSPGNIIKEYPQRGPIKQFRFDKVVAFECFRCGKQKKSKLITIYDDNWNKRMCNGCYGFLLSIYEIKAGTKSENDKVTELANILFKLVSKNEIRIASENLKIKDNRNKHLEEQSIRFLASAEHLSEKVGIEYSLDWSPLVIGLCKALENELVAKLIVPLKEYCLNLDLENDKLDKDIGRIAKYIVSDNSKPPEIGTFSHFLQTALNSKSRRETSNLIKSFYEFLSEYSFSNWILDKDGLLKSLQIVSKEYRNKAAHIEELSKSEFNNCKELLTGESGVIWKLNKAMN
ncbi:hypothetical protein [Lacinutrix venerupis]|uniref:Uncharacterized protein n=1 Tax=Lacinutrix venerupis TaxID=1486034 RepID=A0AAC9LJX2_9FLAO|nr:hypothetical protein [Lacinutrix venerupis]APX99729.1 hypothetical protein BWR22_05200 [Lacinutrix venerupis]